MRCSIVTHEEELREHTRTEGANKTNATEEILGTIADTSDSIYFKVLRSI